MIFQPKCVECIQQFTSQLMPLTNMISNVLEYYFPIYKIIYIFLSLWIFLIPEHILLWPNNIIGLGSRHCLHVYRTIRLWIDGGDRLPYSAVWSMLCEKVEACPVCSAFWSSVYEKYNLTKFFTRPL